jgi:DEAD/DEAH box helicase domain-containing protein
MTDMLEAFDGAIANHFTVVERVNLAARPEHREPVPAAFQSGGVGRWLSGLEFANGLWTHQAEALRRFENGANIVIATGTASGKSLVFQAAAVRTLDLRPDAAVLVFYPLKALLADQLVSWQQVVSAAGWPANSVARLDGDILPDERAKLMESARVILATPDVTHAWLMRNFGQTHA